MPLHTVIVLFAASVAALTTPFPSLTQALSPSIEIAGQRGHF